MADSCHGGWDPGPRPTYSADELEVLTDSGLIEKDSGGSLDAVPPWSRGGGVRTNSCTTTGLISRLLAILRWLLSLVRVK